MDRNALLRALIRYGRSDVQPHTLVASSSRAQDQSVLRAVDASQLLSNNRRRLRNWRSASRPSVVRCSWRGAAHLMSLFQHCEQTGSSVAAHSVLLCMARLTEHAKSTGNWSVALAALSTVAVGRGGCVAWERESAHRGLLREAARSAGGQWQTILQLLETQLPSGNGTTREGATGALRALASLKNGAAVRWQAALVCGVVDRRFVVSSECTSLRCHTSTASQKNANSAHLPDVGERGDSLFRPFGEQDTTHSAVTCSPRESRAVEIIRGVLANWPRSVASSAASVGSVFDCMERAMLDASLCLSCAAAAARHVAAALSTVDGGRLLSHLLHTLVSDPIVVAQLFFTKFESWARGCPQSSHAASGESSTPLLLLLLNSVTAQNSPFAKALSAVLGKLVQLPVFKAPRVSVEIFYWLHQSSSVADASGGCCRVVFLEALSAVTSVSGAHDACRIFACVMRDVRANWCLYVSNLRLAAAAVSAVFAVAPPNNILHAPRECGLAHRDFLPLLLILSVLLRSSPAAKLISVMDAVVLVWDSVLLHPASKSLFRDAHQWPFFGGNEAPQQQPCVAEASIESLTYAIRFGSGVPDVSRHVQRVGLAFVELLSRQCTLVTLPKRTAFLALRVLDASLSTLVGEVTSHRSCQTQDPLPMSSLFIIARGEISEPEEEFLALAVGTYLLQLEFTSYHRLQCWRRVSEFVAGPHSPALRFIEHLIEAYHQDLSHYLLEARLKRPVAPRCVLVSSSSRRRLLSVAESFIRCGAARDGKASLFLKNLSATIFKELGSAAPEWHNFFCCCNVFQERIAADVAGTHKAPTSPSRGSLAAAYAFATIAARKK